jgi:hypothetical protein
MFAMGGVEVLVFGALLWALGAWLLYWIIRLAVRHGSLDAVRQDRLEEERRHARRSTTGRGA